MTILLKVYDEVYINPVSIDTIKPYDETRSTITLKSNQVIVVPLAIQSLIDLLQKYGIESFPPKAVAVDPVEPT